MKSGASILMLLLAVSLFAQEPDKAFQAWDKNKDGKLTKDELPPNAQRNFDLVDTDNDNFISPKEHAAFRNRDRKRPIDSNMFAKMKVTRDIPYAATDNPRQTLDIYLPKKRSTDNPLPVVAFIHGGGWRAGNKNNGHRFVGRFVESGDYVGVSIGYRLTDEASWPAQGHDCKAAIRWLKANAKKYNIDPEKIGVWGTSAGGHLVAYLGTSGNDKSLEGTLGEHTEQNSRVACVVDYFGPTNFLTMGDFESRIDHNAANSPEGKLLGGAPPKMIKIAKSASPITHVDKDDPPMLIAHGTKDPLVPFPQSTSFQKQLRSVGAKAFLITMKDAGHGFRHEKLDDIVSRFFAMFLHGDTSEIHDETIETGR